MDDKAWTEKAKLVSWLCGQPKIPYLVDIKGRLEDDLLAITELEGILPPKKATNFFRAYRD